MDKEVGLASVDIFCWTRGGGGIFPVFVRFFIELSLMLLQLLLLLFFFTKLTLRRQHFDLIQELLSHCGLTLFFFTRYLAGFEKRSPIGIPSIQLLPSKHNV